MLPLVLAGIGGALLLRNPKRKRRAAKRRNPGVRSARSTLFAAKIKLPKQGERSVLSAHSLSDAAKILKRVQAPMKPTSMEYARAAVDNLKIADKWRAIWDRAANKAARETFGRPFEFSDYRVSGIGRDEFPERYKRILRKAAQESGDRKRIAATYAYLARAKDLAAVGYDPEPKPLGRNPRRRRNPGINAKRDLAAAIKAHNRRAEITANDNYNLANNLGSQHARTICRLAAMSDTGEVSSKVTMATLRRWAAGLLPPGAGYKSQDRHPWMEPYLAVIGA